MMKKRIAALVLAVILTAALLPPIPAQAATAQTTQIKTICADDYGVMAVKKDGSMYEYSPYQGTAELRMQDVVSVFGGRCSYSGGEYPVSVALKSDGSLWSGEAGDWTPPSKAMDNVISAAGEVSGVYAVRSDNTLWSMWIDGWDATLGKLTLGGDRHEKVEAVSKDIPVCLFTYGCLFH